MSTKCACVCNIHVLHAIVTDLYVICRSSPNWWKKFRIRTFPQMLHKYRLVSQKPIRWPIFFNAISDGGLPRHHSEKMIGKFIVDYFSPDRSTLGLKFIEILACIIYINIFWVNYCKFTSFITEIILMKISVVINQWRSASWCQSPTRHGGWYIKYTIMVATSAVVTSVAKYYLLDGALKPAILVNNIHNAQQKNYGKHSTPTAFRYNYLVSCVPLSDQQNLNLSTDWRSGISCQAQHADLHQPKGAASSTVLRRCILQYEQSFSTPFRAKIVHL